jgi:hypothetical protein
LAEIFASKGGGCTEKVAAGVEEAEVLPVELLPLVLPLNELLLDVPLLVVPRELPKVAPELPVLPMLVTWAEAVETEKNKAAPANSDSRNPRRIVLMTHLYALSRRNCSPPRLFFPIFREF